MIDYDRIAREYARSRRVNPAVLHDLVITGRLHRSSKVLEIGCGTGNYIAAIAGTLGCPCWGIDPSEEMLALAPQHLGANLVLQKASAAELSFAAGSFDLIFSVDVIHHLPDRATYFATAHELLTSTGCFCTVTDSEAIIRARDPLSRYFPETVAVELRRYPTIAQVTAELHGANFGRVWDTTTEFSYTISDLTPYRERVYSALHLISDAAFTRGLARMEADLAKGPIPAVARYAHLWACR